jgi:predicted transcriptional regulator
VKVPLSSSNVLAEVLNLLCSKGAITIGEIVRRIGVPQNTVAQIINVLLAEGIIIRADTCNTCSGCPLRDFCGSPRSHPTEIYVLTVRGLRVCSRRKRNSELRK